MTRFCRLGYDGMVDVEGVEPSPYRLSICCFCQLSDTSIVLCAGVEPALADV